MILCLSNIYEMSSDSGGGSHCRADKMRASTTSLTTLEIAVAGRGTAFAFGEAVAVHGDTHRAPRLTPIRAGIAAAGPAKYACVCSPMLGV